jgi:hypothetical protein
VGLALACAVAAMAAKEVMNLYTWTVGASHTPAALLAVAGAALPFDVTDAVASFLFGLAFAPELTRLLTRVRVRLNVTWDAASVPAPGPGRGGPQDARGLGSATTPVLALALVAALAAMPAGGARARALPDRPDPRGSVHTARSEAGAVGARASVASEIAYLTGAQNADGGFGAARGQPSEELYTAWAAMGLAAVGRNPASVRRGGHTPLDALGAQVRTLHGVGDIERTILAVHACGASVYSFARYNLVAELLRGRARDHSFAHQANLTAFAIFALRAAGHSPSYGAIHQAAAWLERQQNSDGGFGFAARGSASDVDDTAAVSQALFDAGVRNAHALGGASRYLVRAQNLDGGYPQRPGGESNAQSTAWAAQGLLAAGRDPSVVRRRGSRSPIEYLESLVAPGGSVRYSRTGAQTPVWVTAQALIALARRIFPV